MVDATQRPGAVGKVWLVGAGPGDPGLITVRGAECLRQADVVVYDRLAGPGLRRYAPQAEWIDVGKQPDHHPVPQEQINALLIEQARQGRRVVRLKGGDPFVFGRGGEEALALVEAGLPFEVVPGVTSAVAVPAYAGIPVTQRSLVTSFAVMTGHRAEESIRKAPGVDCSDVHADTRVFLMGIHNLESIVQGLLNNGCSRLTPAAVIAQGATPHQQVVVGTLGDIVAQAAHVAPPAITIVGEVVRLREQLRWFDRADVRPLLGLRVLNTRPRETGGLDDLTAALEPLGAAVVELPAFRLAAPDDPAALDQALAELARGSENGAPAYDWILFTSANAVRFFLERFYALGYDARRLAGVRIGAVGRATAERLRDDRLHADFVPSRFSGLDWAAEAGDLHGRRILLPRSAIGTPELVAALEAQGARVTTITAYAPAPVDPEPEALAALAGAQVDVAVYFSPSAVYGAQTMLAAAGATRAAEQLAATPAACIGPTTAAAARQAGLPVAVMPAEYTVEGLVEALVQWQAQRVGRL